jgi:imidazolonepropionase-like amidohydrolase
MHAHVPPSEDVQAMKDVLMLFAVNGITTIRGMLGHPKHLELRASVNNGEIIGPRLYTTGPSLNGYSVKTEGDAERMVREQKAAGYDYLKLHPGLTMTTFPVIIETANEVGIPFAGHVSFRVGIWNAIKAKYSSIDHLDGFIEGMVPGIDTLTEQQTGLFGMFIADRVDESKMPALLKGLKEHNIWVVPTQALAERWFNPSYTADDFHADPNSKYMSKEIVEQWVTSKNNLVANEQYQNAHIEHFIDLRRRIINACQDSGVNLLLGSDAPQVFNVPGFSAHQELQYLVEAGLTPYQALQTGTVNVARYLGRADSGTLEPGKAADLVLISGNPLIDISATQDIEGVMLNGKWLSKDYITRSLNALID